MAKGPTGGGKDDAVWDIKTLADRQAVKLIKITVAVSEVSSTGDRTACDDALRASSRDG